MPFDGRRLRLSTGRDAQNVSYCEIELNADDTCREVSRSFVFPPSSTGEGQSAMSATGTGDFDTQTLQQYASGKVVRFCLSAVDGPAAKKGKDRRLQDETPDRASDDSSDVESVVDDEDLGEEGDDGSSEEEDYRALPKKKKKKKTKSKKREEPVRRGGRGRHVYYIQSVVSGTARDPSSSPDAATKRRRRSTGAYPSDDDDYVPRREMRKDDDGWRARGLVRDVRVAAGRASPPRRRVPSPGPPRRLGADVRHDGRRRFQAAGDSLSELSAAVQRGRLPDRATR